jgi:hypothetical protein
MATELTRQSILGVSKQGATTALRAHATFPRTFLATQNGSAGGIDIVASTLATYASADDDFVGMKVEVISGAQASGGEGGAPLRGKVISYDHSAQTLTVEALGFSTLTGDSFKLLESDNGYWAEDTGAHKPW